MTTESEWLVKSRWTNQLAATRRLHAPPLTFQINNGIIIFSEKRLTECGGRKGQHCNLKLAHEDYVHVLCHCSYPDLLEIHGFTLSF